MLLVMATLHKENLSTVSFRIMPSEKNRGEGAQHLKHLLDWPQFTKILKSFPRLKRIKFVFEPALMIGGKTLPVECEPEKDMVKEMLPEFYPNGIATVELGEIGWWI